jgi:hypothetical protein
MHLTQLVYVSTANDPASLVGDNILNQSRKNNKEHDVTGMLHHCRGFYMQCLEGSRESVNFIYNKIVRDIRHSNVTLLAYRYVSERSFPNWSMAFVESENLNNDKFFKYTVGKNFNPYSISAESADLLLKELSGEITD